MRVNEQLNKLLKVLPKSSPRNYGEVMKLENGKAIITDGFKLKLGEVK